MSKKILIIDDEPDILSLATVRLKNAGYEILTAESAEKALEFLKENTPDLILLDLILPGMQGDELCKHLKSEYKFKNIPIILFTASITELSCKLLDSCADSYIMKPFEPQDLLDKIKALIG